MKTLFHSLLAAALISPAMLCSSTAEAQTTQRKQSGTGTESGTTVNINCTSEGNKTHIKVEKEENGILTVLDTTLLNPTEAERTALFKKWGIEAPDTDIMPPPPPPGLEELEPGVPPPADAPQPPRPPRHKMRRIKGSGNNPDTLSRIVYRTRISTDSGFTGGDEKIVIYEDGPKHPHFGHGPRGRHFRGPIDSTLKNIQNELKSLNIPDSSLKALKVQLTTLKRELQGSREELDMLRNQALPTADNTFMRVFSNSFPKCDPNGKGKQKVIMKTVVVSKGKKDKKTASAERTAATEASELVISPNPSDGKFNLNLKTADAGSPVNISVTDMAGREVHKQVFTPNGAALSADLDLTHLQRGVYVVKTTQGSQTYTRKVSVEK